MKILLSVFLFACFIQPGAFAQNNVNVRDIIIDLKKQGIEQQYLKNAELLTGIHQSFGKTCTPRALQYQKFARRVNGIDRPLKNHYWLSVNDRKTALMVRKTPKGYRLNGVLSFIEQVDANTYKVREVYCACSDCVEKHPDGTVTVQFCFLDETPEGFTCSESPDNNCRLVDHTFYYCGRVVFQD